MLGDTFTPDETQQIKSGIRVSFHKEMVFSNGNTEWVFITLEHGEFVGFETHRLDGPAKTFIDGSEEWHIRGIRIDIAAFLKEFDLTLPLDDIGISLLGAKFG